MKKIIALGDIHGRTDWKQVAHSDYDKLIFIGDYFDSFDQNKTADKQINNFLEIVKLKVANPDRVILLMGNHDYHYLRGVSEHYSGFQHYDQDKISDIVNNVVDCGLLSLCHVEETILDTFLFVHAGVTKSWAKQNNINVSAKKIEKEMNLKFRENPSVFGFSKLGRDNSGDDICQGPLWVRPASLKLDPIDKLTQVVGHTQQRIINSAHSGIIFIDVPEQYLEITDGIIRVKYY